MRHPPSTINLGTLNKISREIKNVPFKLLRVYFHQVEFNRRRRIEEMERLHIPCTHGSRSRCLAPDAASWTYSIYSSPSCKALCHDERAASTLQNGGICLHVHRFVFSHRIIGTSSCGCTVRFFPKKNITKFYTRIPPRSCTFVLYFRENLMKIELKVWFNGCTAHNTIPCACDCTAFFQKTPPSHCLCTPKFTSQSTCLSLPFPVQQAPHLTAPTALGAISCSTRVPHHHRTGQPSRA